MHDTPLTPPRPGIQPATDPAAAGGVCVWVLGAPGLGKSTVAEALKQAFRAPIIELGDLRGMHLLDPAYGDESAQWNADEMARPLYPLEHRLDTTGQRPEETIAAAQAVVEAWLTDAGERRPEGAAGRHRRADV